MFINTKKKFIFIFTILSLLFSYKTSVSADTYYLYESYIDDRGFVLYTPNSSTYKDLGSYVTLTDYATEDNWIISGDGLEGIEIVDNNKLKKEACNTKYVSIEKIGDKLGVKCLSDTEMNEEKYIDYLKKMYDYNTAYYKYRAISEGIQPSEVPFSFGIEISNNHHSSNKSTATEIFETVGLIKSNTTTWNDFTWPIISYKISDEYSLLASSIFTLYSNERNEDDPSKMIFKFSNKFDFSSEDLNNVKYIFTREPRSFVFDKFTANLASKLKAASSANKNSMLEKYTGEQVESNAYYVYRAAKDIWAKKIKMLYSALNENCENTYSAACSTYKTYALDISRSFKKWFNNVELYSFADSFSKENRAKINTETELEDIEYFLFYDFANLSTGKKLSKDVYIPLILNFISIYDKDTNLNSRYLIDQLIDETCTNEVIPSLPFKKVAGIEYYNNKSKVDLTNECKSSLRNNSYYKSNEESIVYECEKSDELLNICVIDDVIKNSIEPDCKTKAEKVCTYRYQEGTYYCEIEHKKTRDTYINECKDSSMLYKISEILHNKIDNGEIAQNKNNVYSLLDKIKNNQGLETNNYKFSTIEILEAEVDCKDFEMLHWAWNAIVIIAPFLLIIFAGIDYFKVVMQSSDEGMKALKKNLPKRVIALILLILVPTILYFIFSFIDSDSSFVESARCIIKGE